MGLRLPSSPAYLTYDEKEEWKVQTLIRMVAESLPSVYEAPHPPTPSVLMSENNKRKLCRREEEATKGSC